MDQLWQANAGLTQWQQPSAFSIGYPTSGDKSTNQHPTHIGGWWFQSMINEIRNVITYSGMLFDPTDTTQLLRAVQYIVAPSFELREDDGEELREDDSIEERQ